METQRITQLFAASGRFKLIRIKECEFKRWVRRDSELRRFADEREPAFYRETRRRKVSHEHMLSAIRDGRLFGVAVVSISLPIRWKEGGFQHALSPREYFEEFCPLFQNREVRYEDVGSYTQGCIRLRQLIEKCRSLLKEMQRKAAEDGRPVNRAELVKRICQIRFKKPLPRRMLISSRDAEKITVTTPLLRWYMGRDMNIQLFQLIEYGGLSCFKPFVEEVTRARQAGTSLHAQSMKVLGIFSFSYSETPRSVCTNAV